MSIPYWGSAGSQPSACCCGPIGSGKPWMAAFGKLRHLRRETAKINRIIEEEFEQIEAEDRL
jgi:phosphate starvation-inducible protein PhoH